MDDSLPLSDAPELVFGVVAPIGVDIDIVVDVLDHTLQEMGYEAQTFQLTKLMQEIPTGVSISTNSTIQSYRDRIRYANDVRRQLGDAALAALVISAIRAFRTGVWVQRQSEGGGNPSIDEKATAQRAETPLPNQAYIVRQIKRPEEVALLRSVYGRQFILISAYAPQETRKRRIADRERRMRGGLISEVEATNSAHELVTQDANESSDEHGQNVRDAFPLGDVFIDATSRRSCEEMVRRFINLLFGNNAITPTHDEYGMYIAKSASLRSSDLSRQVGAAIFRASGEVISMGCNEVPKSGGGTYWSGEQNDRRDFVVGLDPNEFQKVEILVDVIDRLKKGRHLSAALLAISDPNEIAKRLLREESEHSVSDSRIMDLIEFGRIIHAEMSAICDASRKGVPAEGGTLYCTAFPCHLCAKHIVATGLSRVVYLEPYPKSYAANLHSDSIAVDHDSATKKVRFDAFIGVSPFRYRDLFEKGRRKYATGLAQEWNKGKRQPMIEVYQPSYFQAETHIVGKMKSKLEEILRRNEAQNSTAHNPSGPVVPGNETPPTPAA